MLQCDSEFAWNGRRSLMEHPGPKMAAARTSAGDYQKLGPIDTKNANEPFRVTNPHRVNRFHV